MKGDNAVFGFGIPELLIIGAIVMLIFGVGKLPEIGSSFGKAINNFKKAVNEKDQIELNPKSDSKSSDVS
jgi:sec-independent protein translocase protein TatA